MVVRIRCNKCLTVWNIPFSQGKGEVTYSFDCDCKKIITIEAVDNEIRTIKGGTEIEKGHTFGQGAI